MRRFITAVAAGSICCLSPAAPAEAQGKPLVEELRCPKFDWVAVEGLSDKAAMKVPVELDGTGYMFQLDTGAHISFAGADEAQRRGWRSPEKDRVDVRAIKVAGTPVLPTRLHLLEGKTGGTVGLDLLLGTYVVIDYPRQRICVLTTDRVPAGLDEPVAWERASLRYGKLFVPMKLGEERFAAAFFDTGASMFPLNVDLGRWKVLTGKADTAAADRVFEVPSWGKKIPLAGAATHVPLSIAGVQMQGAVVYTNPAAPDFFKDQIGGGAEGLLGNAMFLDEVVVLDLTPSMRFGVLKKAEPATAK